MESQGLTLIHSSPEKLSDKFTNYKTKSDLVKSPVRIELRHYGTVSGPTFELLNQKYASLDGVFLFQNKENPQLAIALKFSERKECSFFITNQQLVKKYVQNHEYRTWIPEKVLDKAISDFFKNLRSEVSPIEMIKFQYNCPNPSREYFPKSREIKLKSIRIKAKSKSRAENELQDNIPDLDLSLLLKD